jgi:hypothetical protein
MKTGNRRRAVGWLPDMRILEVPSVFAEKFD